MSELNPSTDASGPSAAIIAPPGTPGPATMHTASRSMKFRKSGKSWGMPLIRQTVSAQHVIFIIDPGMWIVAQSGTVKPATLSLTPFFIV